MDMDHLIHILTESLRHTFFIMPVLFCVFLFVEIITHTSKPFWITRVTSNQYLGPIATALLGLLPQCGFSVAATTMFLEGLIPVGSLISAYISTSDEAIPILLGDSVSLPWVVPLLATKLIWGTTVGIIINLAAKRNKFLCPGEPPVPAHEHVHSCIGKSAETKEIIYHAFSRMLKISAMIFVLSSVFNYAGHIGEGHLMNLLTANGWWQPVVASLAGLIPSCATSVALAEGFRTGILSFSAMLSGLTSNAGLALLVLFKESRDKSSAFSVVGLLVVAACIAGFLATLLIA